jgi:hypothetical protein
LAAVAQPTMAAQTLYLAQLPQLAAVKAAVRHPRQTLMVAMAVLAAVVETPPEQAAQGIHLAHHHLKEITVEMAAAHRVLVVLAAVALLLLAQMAQEQLVVMVAMAPHHLFLGHP